MNGRKKPVEPLTKGQNRCIELLPGRNSRPEQSFQLATDSRRGITRMKKLSIEEAVNLYSRYSELEARANRVMLDVNAIYLRGKLTKMKELLKGFSVFASEVSKAMISIANDVKRIMMINNDISSHKESK
jgi:hypothetical protein